MEEYVLLVIVVPRSWDFILQLWYLNPVMLQCKRSVSPSWPGYCSISRESSNFSVQLDFLIPLFRWLQSGDSICNNDIRWYPFKDFGTPRVKCLFWDETHPSKATETGDYMVYFDAFVALLVFPVIFCIWTLFFLGESCLLGWQWCTSCPGPSK